MKTNLFSLRAKIEPQPNEDIVYLTIYLQFQLPGFTNGFFSTFALN